VPGKCHCVGAEYNVTCVDTCDAIDCTPSPLTGHEIPFWKLSDMVDETNPKKQSQLEYHYFVCVYASM